MKPSARMAVLAIAAVFGTLVTASPASATTGDATITTSCSAAGTVVLNGEFTNTDFGSDDDTIYVGLNTSLGIVPAQNLSVGETATLTLDTAVASVPRGSALFFFGGVYGGGDAQGAVPVLYNALACGDAKPITFADVPLGLQFSTEIGWLAAQGISTGWLETDGTRSYRPWQPVNRDAMAAFMYRLAGSPHYYVAPRVPPFTDVATDNQFYKEISWLADQGISTGWLESDGTHTYRPLQPVNRDAMAAFMYRFSESPTFTSPATSPFGDVAPGVLFYKEMTWLASSGISTGWPDGTYRPGLPVNRDAMAAFMYRLAN